jgi:methylenetetrahydrofolate reductase (NADPH)
MTIAATGSPQLSQDEIAAHAAELLVCGSLEMGVHRPEDAGEIAKWLPAGTPVYVNHLPRHRLQDALASLVAVRDAGLDPVPHIAARRIETRGELERFLRGAVDAARVRKVLLIGGDEPDARGPYADAAALLGDGLLAGCGVREVGIAGYPEGHPRIASAVLERAFFQKLELAETQAMGSFVVTQFSFAPARVVEYCATLARRAPRVPLYVGFAGPTSAGTLLRFAQRCGVSASLRALRAQGFGAARLVTHTDPGAQLAIIARYCVGHASCNVVGAHVFSFGAVAATAQWMNGYIAAFSRR